MALGRPADVLAPGGIAIHGGIGPCRNVERADDVLGQNTSEGIIEGNPERRLGPDVSEDSQGRVGSRERRVQWSRISDRSQARFVSS